MEACDVLVGVLVEGGVRYFAGMAGSTVSPFIAAAARAPGAPDPPPRDAHRAASPLGAPAAARAPGARYLPVRHEHVAASLLDATARLTGSPGCVMVHSAAGTLAASL